MRGKRQFEVGSGFSLIELICVVLATALLAVLVVPLSAQMRGDDWALVTRNNLRAYAVAHAEYVHDYGWLPPLGGLGDSTPGNESSNALNHEVGLFDSPAAPVSGAMMAMVSGFNDNYVPDPVIYTSPADEHYRVTEPGGIDFDDGRYGHLLLPSEDPEAAGGTFSRVYYRGLRGFVGRFRLMPIEVDGLVEHREVWLQSAEHVPSPADHVDLVEEDERSFLNNSIFNLEGFWHADPLIEANRIARRHPNDSGHVSYFDGHVDAIERVTERYWQEERERARVRLFWPTYDEPG